MKKSRMGIDLLNVNVGNSRKKVYQELSEDYSALEPPFWAALTAGFMRNRGYSVKILDANAENLTHEETCELINDYNPKLTNIIVYGQHPSASTALMPEVRNLCEAIKEKGLDTKIILSGLHPSALPKRTMDEEKCNFVIEGEGFYTLLSLAEEHNPSEIKGLWFRKGKEIVSNARAENIRDLTKELSDVAWDLLPMDKYKAHNWHCFGDLESRKSYAAISTTLGCPFTCNFCCINAPFGKPSYRSWSPEWVLNQLDTLANNYGIKNIKIIDELFVLNPNNFMPICEGLAERGHNFNIWAYARVDTTKEKHLETMQKAGINWLALGIEAANEEVRKGVVKGRFKTEDVTDVVQSIKKNKINIIGNYIFGLPDDNLDTMNQTLEFAKELNCEFANFYSAMAYPGSKLYAEAKARGTALPEDFPEISWNGYSQHSYCCTPLTTDYLSAKEVLQFRDNAFHAYFTNPKYLDMIENKFGLDTRKHIEKMTKFRLKRKILGD